jgi:hypothetical protein
MRSLMQSDSDQKQGRANGDEVDLFFKALFRLGVWAGDLETWYGTRPLAGWVTERRAPAVAMPSTHSSRPSR